MRLSKDLKKPTGLEIGSYRARNSYSENTKKPATSESSLLDPVILILLKKYPEFKYWVEGVLLTGISALGISANSLRLVVWAIDLLTDK